MTRLLLVLATLLLVPAAAARTAPDRLLVLYASDATGPTEIFVADPSGATPVRQVTFGRPPGACFWAAACGFTDPMPSPDGRRLAFWSAGVSYQPRTLWLANIDGSSRREIGTAVAAEWTPNSKLVIYRHARAAPAGVPAQDVLGWTWSPDNRMFVYVTRAGIFAVPPQGGVRRLYAFHGADLSPFPRYPFELAFSPDGQVLAVTLTSGLGLLDVRTRRMRTVATAAASLAWSPDGQRLLFVQRSDSTSEDGIFTGDVRTVTRTGHVRVVVSRSAPYGGQIVAAAWVAAPAGIAFRSPERLDGAFAGGPVQKLSADGDEVAFASCGGVSVWDERTGTTTAVQPTGICWASFSRSGHIGTLALAGDRVLWWSAYTGLGFLWSMYQATVGFPPQELTTGSGNLGATPATGSGTAVGAGSLLVMSSWALHWSDAGAVIGRQSIERVDLAGCPCPTISTSAGRYTPLDVDQGRIVVSSGDDTRVLAADGTVLLTVPVLTVAAQLDGSQLVIATGSELRVYDAVTGGLRATWPLPAQPVGHDCDYFGDPTCPSAGPATQLTLEDVHHGLAAYVYAGRVHVLRLDDGDDSVVGDGTLARFTNAGLAYADGARVRLRPYGQLPG